MTAENALSGVGYFPNLLYPFLVARGEATSVLYCVASFKTKWIMKFFFSF